MSEDLYPKYTEKEMEEVKARIIKDKFVFNPRVSDFLERHKNITMIGMMWSLWWRLYLAIIAVSFAIAIVVAGVSTLFGS